MMADRRSTLRLVKTVETKDDWRIIVYYDRPPNASSETGDDG